MIFRMNRQTTYQFVVYRRGQEYDSDQVGPDPATLQRWIKNGLATALVAPAASVPLDPPEEPASELPDRDVLEEMTIAQIRVLADELKIELPKAGKKTELIDIILDQVTDGSED